MSGPSGNYNLGQIKWKISDGKMARFGLHAASSLIWGKGGISVPFYFGQDCNLGQIKWKIETTPPPKISDGKMARFGLHAASSLIWEEGGISVPFYFVQDCLRAPAWRYQ